MSEYNKELRDRIEQNLRMFDYPHFDSDDIFCVLGEIDRLNKRITELEQENARLLSAITEISELTQEFSYDSTTQEFSYDRTMLQIKEIVDKITGVRR